MTLEKLFIGIEYAGSLENTDVKDVTSDSRKVSRGSVFVCIKGRRFDGHDLAAKALEAGAVAVVTERPLGFKNEAVVKDTRAAYALLCQSFFSNPKDKLTLIAVTGTNGKTTTSSIIKQALCSLGIKTGLIGTIHCEIGDMIVPAKFTTPEAWDTAALFSRMVNAGCTHVVMEASSQALDQGRLLGLRFNCAVFTNLTGDHLDYHGDMESYYQAKKLLFSQSDMAVINLDDEYGKRLYSELSTPKTGFSVKNKKSDYIARNISYAINGVGFELCGKEFCEKVAFSMPGVYSVHNALGAACALFAAGIDKSSAVAAVSTTKGVKGRCEVLYSDDVTVICDFAHTGDGLEQLLSSLRPFVKGRMVTLFGCAGDRDPIKRPAMAKAVCRYSDFIVLTSDNPRTEDPLKIISEVSKLIRESENPFTAEPDRLYAIRWALNNLEKDDVLVLCGKGHEDYQVIDGCTIYLDEHRIVREFFEKNKREESAI